MLGFTQIELDVLDQGQHMQRENANEAAGLESRLSSSLRLSARERSARRDTYLGTFYPGRPA